MRRQSLACAHVTVFVETNCLKAVDPQYNASRTGTSCLSLAMEQVAKKNPRTGRE
jgi:hypothetical protein